MDEDEGGEKRGGVALDVEEGVHGGGMKRRD